MDGSYRTVAAVHLFLPPAADYLPGYPRPAATATRSEKLSRRSQSRPARVSYRLLTPVEGKARINSRARVVTTRGKALTLQLLFAMSSESMGHHDSGPDDWWRVG